MHGHAVFRMKFGKDGCFGNAVRGSMTVHTLGVLNAQFDKVHRAIIVDILHNLDRLIFHFDLWRPVKILTLYILSSNKGDAQIGLSSSDMYAKV